MQSIHEYLYKSDNEELLVETLRVLCNLSRNAELAEVIIGDQEFIKAQCRLLESENQEIQYYNIGLIINLS